MHEKQKSQHVLCILCMDCNFLQLTADDCQIWQRSVFSWSSGLKPLSSKERFAMSLGFMVILAEAVGHNWSIIMS